MTDDEIKALAPGSIVHVSLFGKSIAVTIRTVDAKNRKLFTTIGPISFDNLISFAGKIKT